MKIPIALLLILITLTGCQIGGSSSFKQGMTVKENNALHQGEPVTGDWMVKNMLAEPESLNPFTSTSASATNIYQGYIYESFLQTERKPPWEEEPLLVVELPESSEDHLTYKWKLRKDIYFHDGSHMTMHDAVFTLKAIMNPYADDLPTKPYYGELDSLSMPDEYSLIMYCSQPYFLHTNFFGGFEVLPKHIFDLDGLMDDLSYYQVKNGSVYGRIADFLDEDENKDFVEFYPGLAMVALEKSIENVSNGEIKWLDIETLFKGESGLGHNDKLKIAIQFLEEHPDGTAGIKLAENAQISAKAAIGMLEIGSKISDLSKAGDFSYRNELKQKCRDIHDRIEKFGRAFNMHEQNRAPTVGSGPFKFDRWLTGQEIVIKRNEEYWRGEGHAYLDKIIWRVLTDYTASLVALKNGEIDFMERLQTIQYLTMTNQTRFLDKFIKSSYIIPQYTYFGWRTTHPLFSDPDVRLAMTHMVRRKDAVEKLQFGFAEIVTSNFYRYGMDYDSTIVPYKYNPDRAQELLKKAGWEDIDDDGILEKDSLEFRFEMLIPSGSSFAEQLVSILREDLYMIGIEMDIRRLEWSVFINNYIRNHNF